MSTTLFLTEYTALREKYKTLLSGAFTPSVWKSKQEYSRNDLVKSTIENGSYYRCIQAGTSGEKEPVWTTTFWSEITDGTVKWRQEEPVFILDTEPSDFSYPCILVGNIFPISEVQRATGNQPASELMTYILIITYQFSNKTYQQTRLEAYDILGQVQNVIRAYPTLSSFPGVLRSVGGLYILPETLPVFFKIQQSWITRLLVKQEG
ncbi:MAG: hypothetical protein BWX89_01125 [candidate division TA06 bacterium ADurb.Bin131]|uniref:Uncharacterized protein n=1 Tax=candidate division TA06 bacterium ADurb.Bin131 TaxID=1852827 RepID=A0A1V6C7W2_UNCT6|nr:MAG: hypothetical protein BWX89_01125 [candidate division TA06 bacterium ADurb.Bin131]